jgi:hypothetical protein
VPVSLFSFLLKAQLPEDALRMSYTCPQALQESRLGAPWAAGRDITANYVNPAGLGFYKTGEVVMSPGWSFGSTHRYFQTMSKA